ncbi:MAG: 50S ribosomal protein L29 [Candidatus Gracilibacteria bacterium]|nr:50S ribosomal protein L29 [Candidatus Gracilibacteria bacterium]
MKEIKDLGLKSLKDLQKLDLNSLRKELVGSKKKLFELTMKLELNELKQTHLVKPLRRYIAAINTIVMQKAI